MARTKVAAVAPSVAGAAFAFSAPVADGDAVRPNTVLLVDNGSASPVTVTIQTGGTAGDYAIADPTVVVAAGARRAIGPFTGGVFPQQSGADAGWVYIDYSSVPAGLVRAALAGTV